MQSDKINYHRISQALSAFMTVAGMICPNAAALADRTLSAGIPISSKSDILPMEVISRTTGLEHYDPLAPLMAIDDKGREITFAAYGSLAENWQQRVDLKTYWGIDLKEREYLGDIMGKMGSIPMGENADGQKSTVLSHIGKVLSFKDNKVTFEADRKFFDLVKASAAFYAEPWIDSALFHRAGQGQTRSFNLKTRGDGPPLHLIGLREGNRYLIEAHVDRHPDNLAHGVREVLAGLLGRHIFFQHSFWPDPEGIGEGLTKGNIDTGYKVVARPNIAPAATLLTPQN
jgi:hypothetical protein